ncbi:winged helix-turn-helix domain-containing protein [Falsihalocynthiibacter arcticus]|uniref:winged helix-turn-helix domain-containing protein n=1 Tax=Falsihalocynthiibacter arcticus TaxID=1579316 RepID=UPI003001032E
MQTLDAQGGDAMSLLVDEVMARPAAERLEYALGLLDFYLDPLPAFYDAIFDHGLRLASSDARLLYLLDLRRGRFVSAEDLLAATMVARPGSAWPDPQTIYGRVRNLRASLTRASLPLKITNWPGVGYRMDAPAGFTLMRGAA